MNHPPPDASANIKLIDFDLPHSFFPSNFSRHIPYISLRDEARRYSERDQARATRTKNVFRAVAMVATDTLAHGDELFVDYLQDRRVAPEAI